MIKLLFVIDRLEGGGGEKALVNLVNGLDPAAFDLTVRTVWPGGEPLLKPHIRIHCLNPRGSKWAFLGLRLWAALGCPGKYREDYDMEIAYLECFPTKLLAKPSNAVKLAWVHCDMDHKEEIEKMRRWYRQYDRVVCVSEDVEESFLRHFDARTAVLPNVVNFREIGEKSKEFPVESFDVLGVGRLSPEKGFDRLLTACRGLHTRIGILGEGPERHNLEVQAIALGLDVTFLGHQENPYPYMASAKILAIPSRSEGLSTVAQEGLFLGKAMVATKCAGMEALLGGCAILTEDLASGLQILLSREALRRELEEKAARRGRELAAADNVKRTEDFFKEVLREQRGWKWQSM